MSKIKVLIVDDHVLMREGIHTLLDLVADFDVVGEASNGKEAVEKVRELHPDVVLMDLAMPVMTGREARGAWRGDSVTSPTGILGRDSTFHE